ncbi:uncharacterized protein LOC134789802 isoform X2 [Cydia splendana]|uniref:uncharacterized protein LOC134789802 isoform X2 n=1 Tax=Cydia splendana TaxID=1100963 RepID=UPI00300C39D7
MSYLRPQASQCRVQRFLEPDVTRVAPCSLCHKQLSMHRPCALPSGFAFAVYIRIRHRFLVICVSVTAVLCCVPGKQTSQETRKMQSSTIIVLACLVAVVVAGAHYERYPAVEALQEPGQVHEALYDTPELERSHRTKRGLLLLKKKLLLGALGLKAAKIGAVGAGVAGAIALKSKKSVPTTVRVVSAAQHGHSYSYNSWSG